MGEYTRHGVYCLVGWTLHSLLMALTMTKYRRAIYHKFSEQHNIGEKEAKDQDVPVPLVLKRNCYY